MMGKWHVFSSVMLVACFLPFPSSSRSSNLEGHFEEISMIKKILDTEKKLYDDLCDGMATRKLLKGDPLYKRFFKGSPKREKFAFYGSFNERFGAFSTRYFQNAKIDRSVMSCNYSRQYSMQKPWQLAATTSFDGIAEIDYATFSDIPKTHEKSVVDIESKLRYVRVKGTERIMRQLLPLKSMKSMKRKRKVWQKRLLLHDGFLNSTNDIHLARFRYNKSDVLLFEALSTDIIGRAMSIEIQKSSSKYNFGTLYLMKDSVRKFEIKVQSNKYEFLRLHWWPKIAEEWKFRNRTWPEKRIIDQLGRWVYLKPTSTNDQFKYSFAHVERILTGMRTREQNINYYILKTLFYQQLKPIDKANLLQTYAVKTVMLWTCEMFGPVHEAWDLSLQRDSPSMLQYMLQQLLKAFEEGFLANYFIPKVNVLKNVRRKMRKRVVKRLSIILENFRLFCIFSINDINKVLTNLQGLSSIIHKFLNLLKEASRDGIMATFVKRPGMLAKLSGWMAQSEAKRNLKTLKQSLKRNWKITVLSTVVFLPLILYAIINFLGENKKDS